MHKCLSLLLLSLIVAGLGAPATGQTVINSPPTVIPFAAAYSVSGGTIFNAYEGAEIHATLLVEDGTLNLLGAELTQGANAVNGATVSIHDGNITAGTSEFFMDSGSATTISGGRFRSSLVKHPNATLVMEGVDFELNGSLVPGLVMPGEEVSVAVPQGTLFTGIFASGSPFTFYSQAGSGDRFLGEVILRRSARPTGPAIVNVPAEPIPPGVLPGQVLNVFPGAALPMAMNAAPNSIVNLEGGDAALIELYRAEMIVNSGTAWIIRGYADSTIRLNDGEVTQVQSPDNSFVEVNGGILGTLGTSRNSIVQINGGIVERLAIASPDVVMRGGTITQVVILQPGVLFQVFGGSIQPRLTIPSNAHVIISGGDVPLIETSPDAMLTLRGRSFTVAGESIPGLSQPGDSVNFSDRSDQTIDAVLADGSLFSLYVGNVFQQIPPRDSIATTSTLRLTLVPEPSPLAILFLGLIASAFRRNRPIDLTTCS